MSVIPSPRLLLVGLLCLGLLLAACQEDVAEPATPSPTPSPTPTPEEPEALGAAPLTGVPIFDADELDELLARATVAVKIDNAPAARPQTSLERADIVYEELVEGGATRFIALFQSDVPERIGPIRSARPEDAAVLPAFDAMFFHSGGRAEVLRALDDAGLAWRSEDRSVMSRDGSRRSPHNLMGHGEGLFGLALERVGAASAVPWAFDEEPPAGAVDCPDPCEDDPGESITVHMSRGSVTGFDYDADAGVYRRTQNGDHHAVTGEGAIGAANVVVLGTRVGTGGCCDSAGNPFTETDVVGSGRAVVLRDGTRYEVEWSKSAPGEHLQLTDSQIHKWRTLIALAHVDGQACAAERAFIRETLQKRSIDPATMKILEQDFATAHSPDEFFSKITDPRDRGALFYTARLMFFKDDAFCDYEKMYYDKFKAAHMSGLDMDAIMQQVRQIEVDMKEREEREREEREDQSNQSSLSSLPSRLLDALKQLF
jgi:uncharacterized membrane protein YebE (DUF533 family)